ncbi:MAG: sulfur carrier protein ThiS [Peptococcaceae bacterium]|nr:sulfur carrier protein ThiS [Peptococcaceae bacterium]
MGKVLKVNGADFSLERLLSLREFLIEQGYNPDHVATEINGEVVPKTAYESVVLSDGDVIEIVRFVGGG